MSEQRGEVDFSCVERASYAIHNINNIITVILPNLLKLRANGQQIAPDDLRNRQLELIDNLLRKMERMIAIIKSQQEEYKDYLERTPVDVELMIDEMISLIPEEMRNKIQVEKNIFLGPKPKLNYIKLYQVLSNLVLNAAESLRVSLRDDMLLKFSFERSKDDLLIEVNDNGIGIAPSLINCIWRAGHSTKNGGTGLGLAFCKKVVEQEMGGEITVQSAGIGQGASFLLRFSNCFE